MPKAIEVMHQKKSRSPSKRTKTKIPTIRQGIMGIFLLLSDFRSVDNRGHQESATSYRLYGKCDAHI